MKNKDFLLLKKLTEGFGVSGDEEEIRELILNEFKDEPVKISKDNLNNLFISYCSDPSLPKISFYTHIDEVGFIVTNILDNGFLMFKPIGGWYRHIVLGSKVVIKTKTNKKFIGIIGSEAPHFLTKDKQDKLLDFENMSIDLGMSSKEEVLNHEINIGDFIMPYSETIILNEEIISGKALDDRICATSLILAIKEIIRKDIKANIEGIFTVEEEVGCRGAKTSSFKSESEIGFALDVTDSFDTPQSLSYDCRLNNGVALSMVDGGTIAHLGLLKFIQKTFNKSHIKYTFDPMNVGGTDSSQIHLAKEGVINMTISFPIRYMHSFYSVASFNDLYTLKNGVISIIKNLSFDELDKIKDYKYKKLSK